MSLLVKANDMLEIVVYYKENKNKTIRVIQPEEYDKLEEPKKKDFKPLKFGCRPLTWKMQNDLQREATKNGVDNWDWVGFKEKKLIKILASWEITDDEGKPVPISDQTILQLHPTVAEAVIDQFDVLAYLGDKERKNL